MAYGRSSPKPAKKTAAKAPSKFLVLTSSCGSYNQAEFKSEHPTEAAAKTAAEKASKHKTSNYYGRAVELEYKGVFIVKIVGKYAATCETKYTAVS